MTSTDARSILTAHEAVARQLIVSAGMVGDVEDLQVWQHRCRDWNASLAAALRYLYGEDATRAFLNALNPLGPELTWREALRAQLDRLGDVLEMLQGLMHMPGDGDGRRIGATARQREDAQRYRAASGAAVVGSRP